MMIDWKRLRHAYGAAGDVPALLSKLTPDPEDETWCELWSCLCHQGSVYSASFAAISELADIAARWLPAQRVEPLALAGGILSSSDCRGKGGRDQGEVYFRENTLLVHRLQALCDESLKLKDLPESNFIYLLQAARSFDGDKFWGSVLDQLVTGEFTGKCPYCETDLYLVIGEYGHFTTSEEWVLPGQYEDEVQIRPNVKLSPIVPAHEALPTVGQWMIDRCNAASQVGLAERLTYLFGTSACCKCGKEFALHDAITQC